MNSAYVILVFLTRRKKIISPEIIIFLVI